MTRDAHQPVHKTWWRRFGLSLTVALTLTAAPVATWPSWGGAAGDVSEQELSEALVTTPETAGASTAAPDTDVADPDVVRRSRPGGARDAVFDVSVQGSLVGLTWRPADSPPEGTPVWIRTKGAHGGWSSWTEVLVSTMTDSDAPGATRVGTEPLWAPNTTRVQVRVKDGERQIVTRARVTGIEPKTVRTPRAAGATTLFPTVITRAQWGADESIRGGCVPEMMTTNRAMVVHHTAGTNNYTAAQSASIVRSIYEYHVRTMGWCDIGYNALVDKYGQVFEGRFGGFDRPVRGAHALGFNTDTYGVSVLGTYTTSAPPNAAIESLINVLARRAYTFRIQAGSTVELTSSDSGSRYPAGTRVTLPVIQGHRDTGITACPGDALYALLPQIRARVAAFVDPLIALRPPGTFNLDIDADGFTDLLARDRRTGNLTWVSGSVDGKFGPLKATGIEASDWSLLVATGDVDQDAVPDLLEREPDGRLVLVSLHADGTRAAARDVGTGWGYMLDVAFAGPQNGQRGAPYLYGRQNNGDLWAYYGDGRGGFVSQQRVGTGWGYMVNIMGGADVTGDGVPDLVTRHVNGNLYLYRGIGGGRIAEGQVIGTGWQNFTDLSLVQSSRDNPSMVGVTWDGRLLRYVFNRFTPQFESIFEAGSGWGDQELLW